MRRQYQQGHDDDPARNAKKDTDDAINNPQGHTRHDAQTQPPSQPAHDHTDQKQDDGADGRTRCRTLDGFLRQQGRKPRGVGQRDEDGCDPGGQTDGLAEKAAHVADDAGHHEYSDDEDIDSGHGLVISGSTRSPAPERQV